MSNLNCWEFTKCGRELGGENVSSLGVCPAVNFENADGFCEGKNGGRACAYVAGTFCGGHIQGTVKNKEKECVKCEFYQELKKEHGMGFSVYAFTNYIKNKLGK